MWLLGTTSPWVRSLELAVEVMGLDPDRTEFEFTGGDRGWKGDVPVVRLNTSRIRSPRLGQHHVDPPGDALLFGVHAGGRSLRDGSRDRERPLRRPAVFLDRDGVLNRPVIRDGRPHPPSSLGELESILTPRPASPAAGRWICPGCGDKSTGRGQGNAKQGGRP